jgi:hypothetical protein
VRFRIGDAYDALSCICRPWLDDGRSGSPPRESKDEDEFEDEDDLVATTPLSERYTQRDIAINRWNRFTTF